MTILTILLILSFCIKFIFSNNEVKTIFSFEAVIFDLDGVITQTASLHSAAWKKMFDDYLLKREIIYGEPFKEFTHENDYLSYVDGKPRYEGVRSFLESRNISIPYGNPRDSDDKETICGLGNRKNTIINQILDEKGVDLYTSTIEIINKLRENGIKVGVASSSKNCKHVVEVAKISHLFDTRVDGTTITDQNLKGKPAPDIFLKACENLKVPYFKAVVVEDAVSGVQAASNGHFGLVIGIARASNQQSLKENGADIVVSDLIEIDLQKIEKWFTEFLPEKLWKFESTRFILENERNYESLFGIGNGYFGSRGINVENSKSNYSYPGTYIAGVYNKLDSEIEGRIITNEDLVNLPNWLNITFKRGNKPYFSINSFLRDKNGKIREYSRGIDLKKGISYRNLVIEEENGDKTQLTTEFFASADNPHIGVLSYSIKPLNYNDCFYINSELDGNVKNEGVERYKSFNNQHLITLNAVANNNINNLVVKTNQSDILVVEIIKFQVLLNSKDIDVKWNHLVEPSKIRSEFSCKLNVNDKLTINKIAIFFTNLRFDTADPLKKAKLTLKSLKSYPELYSNHIKKWEYYWDRIDIQITGDRFVQQALRLHSYHLLSTSSIISSNYNFGIPARGLTGESYHGHIFWDEIFIYPFYLQTFPEICRSLLLYRYYCLPMAKKNAQNENYLGAIFPWQSASLGDETTQKFHLNPKSGKWDPDLSYLQRHVSLAICFNIWKYLNFTLDYEFFLNFGADIFFEIVKFWVDCAKFNEKTKKYDISKVMGPDEFHEKVPGTSEIGLKNNFYTNFMVSWLLKEAKNILESLDKKDKNNLTDRLHINQRDLKKWGEISQNLSFSINDNHIFEQFEGYFQLQELDWEKYKKKYGNISRMDRILKAENLSPDFFKVSKQPDVLMLFFLFSIDELKNLFSDLNYSISDQTMVKNFNFYFQRTSHGSTLSKIVFSNIANQISKLNIRDSKNCKKLSWKLYNDALQSDIFDVQGGTTKEGIHTGVMASTVTEMIRSFAGIQIIGGNIYCNPNLPVNLEKIRFNIFFQGVEHNFSISNDLVKIWVNYPPEFSLKHNIYVKNKIIQPRNKNWVEIKLNDEEKC